MDEEPGLGGAGLHLVHDSVEGRLPVAEVADSHAQDEEGGRHPPWHGDLDLRETLERHGVAGDHERTVAGAHAGAMGEEDVRVLHEGVGVEGEGGHLQAPLQRPLVESLDVAEDVLELEAARVHAPAGKRPEHEGVVGVGAVTESDSH